MVHHSVARNIHKCIQNTQVEHSKHDQYSTNVFIIMLDLVP